MKYYNSTSTNTDKWEVLATVSPATSTSYTDTTIPAGTFSRQYKVQAYYGTSLFLDSQNSVNANFNCNPMTVDLKAAGSSTDTLVDALLPSSAVIINMGTRSYLWWDSSNALSCSGSASNNSTSWADSNWVKSQSFSGTTYTATLPYSTNPYLYTLTCTNTARPISNPVSDSVYIRVRDYDPWIQTVGGDVHSNTRINTPGGPP